MKSAPKAKQEEFSQLVAVSLQAAFQGPLQRPDLAASDRTDLAFLLADLLQEARQVAVRIPPRLSLIDAAKDFIAYATDGGPHWYEAPDRPIPAKWMNLSENTWVQGVFGGVQEKIDGRWQSENPEWQGLPYSESATLRLLAHLRRVGTAGRDELEDVLRPFGGGDVEAALRKPVKEAWVARSGDDKTAIWSATEMLLPSEAPPACRSTEPAHPPRDLAAERRRARQLRLSRLPDKPDARALLIELRKHKQMKAHELKPLLPHLDRNATVRLLKQLREAGWLEVVGTTKNAEWRATEKLRTVDFRRRNALAIS